MADWGTQCWVGTCAQFREIQLRLPGWRPCLPEKKKQRERAINEHDTENRKTDLSLLSKNALFSKCQADVTQNNVEEREGSSVLPVWDRKLKQNTWKKYVEPVHVVLHGSFGQNTTALKLPSSPLPFSSAMFFFQNNLGVSHLRLKRLTTKREKWMCASKAHATKTVSYQTSFGWSAWDFDQPSSLHCLDASSTALQRSQKSLSIVCKHTADAHFPSSDFHGTKTRNVHGGIPAGMQETRRFQRVWNFKREQPNLEGMQTRWSNVSWFTKEGVSQAVTHDSGSLHLGPEWTDERGRQLFRFIWWFRWIVSSFRRLYFSSIFVTVFVTVTRFSVWRLNFIVWQISVAQISCYIYI